MPGYDDGTPSLAEIMRMLKDFRDEWRQGVQELVRKDVYAAHIATLEMKIGTLDTKIATLDARNKDFDAGNRSKQNLLYGTALTAGISLFGWILTSIIGGMQ